MRQLPTDPRSLEGQRPSHCPSRILRTQAQISCNIDLEQVEGTAGRVLPEPTAVDPP
jgi:hypothetical protein